MNFSFKKSISQWNIFDILLFSSISSAASISVLQFDYRIQFITSIVAVSTFHLISKNFISNKDYKLFTGILLTVILSYNYIKPFSTSIVLINILTFLTYKVSNNFFFLALISQLGDVITTFIVLPDGSELNPLNSYLIQKTDVLTGLMITKVLFVFLPSIWAYKKFRKNDFRIYIYLITVIGLALTIRNFTLFLK